MFKKLLITALFCHAVVLGQEFDNRTYQNNSVFMDFMQLSSLQLLDTANYYFDRNNYDTALICYNLIINTIPKDADIEQQKIIIFAYNRLTNIYLHISDYRMAYDFCIKKMLFCEKYYFDDSEPSTFLDIGVIYSHLNQHEMAKQYFLKALDLFNDSIAIVLLLNNLGDNELYRGKLDSSFYYINKAKEFSNQHNNVYIYYILSTLASYYQKEKQYDSAFYNFRLSLDYSRIRKDIQLETYTLTALGKLFFEVNAIDSAQYYIGLSNKIASENKFLKILADNYLTLSEIDKSKGKYKNALELYEICINLKDSIYNAGVFSSINMLQRQYENSKTNKQIEDLEIDRKLNENTIRYQRIIWFITLGFLLVVTLVLIVIFF